MKAAKGNKEPKGKKKSKSKVRAAIEENKEEAKQPLLNDRKVKNALEEEAH